MSKIFYILGIILLISISMDSRVMIFNMNIINNYEYKTKQKELFLLSEIEMKYYEMKAYNLLNKEKSNASIIASKIDILIRDTFNTIKWSYAQRDDWINYDAIFENYIRRMDGVNLNSEIGRRREKLIELQMKYELLVPLYDLTIMRGTSCFITPQIVCSDLKDSVYIGTIPYIDELEKIDLYINEKHYPINKNQLYKIPKSDTISVQLEYISYNYHNMKLDTTVHQENYSEY